MIEGAVIAAVLLHYDVDKLTITGTITIYLSLTGANAIIVIVGAVIAAVQLYYDDDKLTITGTITIYFIFDRCQCYYSDSRCCNCGCTAAL